MKLRGLKKRWLLTVAAITVPLVAVGIGAFAFALSGLELSDGAAQQIILTAAAMGALLIAAVLLANLHFLRSITSPILELTEATRRISDGSYGKQCGKAHDDEIGDLTDSINDMSEKLSKAEKMQTEFISSVSHELRTPLTAINGWSETLAYDETIQGESRRGIQIIAKEASRLTKMVEALLEFTRIEDGRFNLSLEQVDVAAELEEVIFTYGELLKSDGIELKYEPEYEDMPIIEADPERLRQVFLNVLDNAAKYGREGKEIIVKLSLSDGWVNISVHNFGPDIPAEELPHIKKKFYKGSSKERGSGIGLAVCDEIVTRHKGLLEIENAPEGGVLVTVKLPAGEQNPNA